MQPNPLNRLGCGSKGPANNYTALKNHAFFEGIDFDSITKINPPGLDSIRQLMQSVRSLKMINVDPEIKNIINKQSSLESHKITAPSTAISNERLIKVLKEGIIKKKSPWFHYNTRKVVLDSSPKIDYIDPFTGALKV